MISHSPKQWWPSSLAHGRLAIHQWVDTLVAVYFKRNYLHKMIYQRNTMCFIINSCKLCNLQCKTLIWSKTTTANRENNRAKQLYKAVNAEQWIIKDFQLYIIIFQNTRTKSINQWLHTCVGLWKININAFYVEVITDHNSAKRLFHKLWVLWDSSNKSYPQHNLVLTWNERDPIWIDSKGNYREAGGIPFVILKKHIYMQQQKTGFIQDIHFT